MIHAPYDVDHLRLHVDADPDAGTFSIRAYCADFPDVDSTSDQLVINLGYPDWSHLVQVLADVLAGEIQGSRRLASRRPDVAWKWSKWTFGFWWDRDNLTLFGVDVGPLEIVWRYRGYRP